MTVSTPVISVATGANPSSACRPTVPSLVLAPLTTGSKHSSGTVPITAAPTTDPSTQDDTDAAAAEEQLHAAISQELGQYIQATGDLVHPDVLAGLASTIAGVMANGEQRVS